MTPNGRASALPMACECWTLPNSRILPGDEQPPPFGKELCSKELIARHRALIEDIREVISLTRKIIDTTREELDAFNFLHGSSRPDPAHESRSLKGAVTELHQFSRSAGKLAISIGSL